MTLRLSELQLALMLLTRLPAGRIAPCSPAAKMADAVWAYPVVGALVGACGAGVLALLGALGLPPMIAAVLAVSACVLVTGGLHEDGLADLADGFGGGRDRAAKLAIMRDSRIGSYGTLALILSIFLRASALAAVMEQSAGLAMAALVAIEVASRAGLAVMLAALPAARSDGLGKSAAEGVPLWRVGLALLFGFGPLPLVFGLAGGAILCGAVALAQAAVSLLALRQIKGQTGDVLGAAQQMGALAAWLALTALAV